MRKVYLLIVLFAIVYTVNAQSFTISPSNTLSETVYENDYKDMTIYMENVSGADLNLEWELVSNTTPGTWSIVLCDYQSCFASIPANRAMDPVPANDQGFIKLTIGPGSDLGSGTIVFNVWEADNRQATEEQITFDVNAIVGIDAVQLDANVSVYPNPAHDYVIMKSEAGTLEQGTVSLINAAGTTVKKETIRSAEAQQLSLENLPAGMYLMLYEAKGAVMTEKIFKTN